MKSIDSVENNIISQQLVNKRLHRTFQMFRNNQLETILINPFSVPFQMKFTGRDFHTKSKTACFLPFSTATAIISILLLYLDYNDETKGYIQPNFAVINN